MPLQVVTIVTLDRSVEVTVPDDRPIGELLPSIAAVCGIPPDASGDELRLARKGGWSIPGERTLKESGVAEGAVLQLSTDAAPGRPVTAPIPPASAGKRAALPLAADAPPSATPGPPAPPTPLGPVARTRAILPPQRSAPGRVSLALGVALRADPAAGQTSAESGSDSHAPRPASLTQDRPASPLTRMRRAWRESDYEAQLDSMIVRPRLHTCATIAVMSPKGGVGKTTLTTLLGTLLALVRRDRIVAIDTNPDYGSLGRTLAPDHNIFVDDLLDVLEHPALTVTKLDTSLARARHGLLVLPAPTAPERMARLDEAAYSRVIQRLQSLAGVILLDCGTGLQEPTSRAALAEADQIVLVSDAEPATASLVAEASELLLRVGSPITLVVNKTTERGRLDIERFAAYIDRAQALVTVPSDPRAAASIATGEFDWSAAPRAWRRATRELAAVLVADWERLGLTI